MEENYNIVGQGVAGRHVNAHDMTFQQIWNQLSGSIDLSALARQLPTLREAMRREATTAEHDIAIGQVAAAEKAAQKSDTSSMLRHLKGAGKWAFDVATKIGVTVAAKVIEKLL